MKKPYLLGLLILFVLVDLGYSFFQSYQYPLEGDLPVIVLPAPGNQQVLQDPFGWAVLTRNEVYVAPNRFFAHAAMGLYFKSVPFWFQRFIDPIRSVYAACALFAMCLQALLLYVLGVYVTGTYRLDKYKLWLAAALLTPLFQAAGYNDQMGIIDHSITYTFFYAFPMTLLLLLLLPFYRAAYYGQPFQLSWPRQLLLVLLMIVLAFNGAIITGAVAVLFFGIVLHWLIKQWQALGNDHLNVQAWLARVRQVPRQPLVLLTIFTALCLYSLYIGLNEAESLTFTLPLWERYLRVPKGIFWQLRLLGLPLLIVAGLLNVQLIRRLLPSTAESRQLIRILQWLGWFALLYILLLPLGGYRVYRPLILRRDSIMPIILGLMYFYGVSSYYLLHHLPARPRRWYIAGVILIGAIYMNADKLWIKNNNACEQRALEALARSPEDIVELDNSCTVVAWGRMEDPAHSEAQAQLLYEWGITKSKKYYYQKEGW